jgi:GT2 family glycosyltransferase
MSEGLRAAARPNLLLSVIIPTYNRKDSLLRTLDSLSRQTCSAERFEVIVVDDGGSDGACEIKQRAFPFQLVYLCQANQGSAAARNYGAQQSRGDVLVFIDDDITLDAGCLAAVAVKTKPDIIVMGLWQPYEPPNPSPFNNSVTRQVRATAAGIAGDEEVAFSECTSNNLAMWREDFIRVGMWQDVLGDGPTLWGDVEFGYRAWRQGCRFVRAADARLIHRDHHIANLAAACKRAYHVSNIVQPLFVLHPEIRPHLRMFHEKEPVDWRQDPPQLILGKLSRQAIWSRPAMWAMQRAVPFLERRAPESSLLASFYQWIISGYIFRGYRAGLRAAAQRPAA